MPFYDYACAECSFVLKDFYRKMTEDVSIFDCPKCGEIMKQQYGNSTLEFKGKGFYETDYRKKLVKKNDAKD